jgi:hypothetical protein
MNNTSFQDKPDLTKFSIIVQASSKSWGGGSDLCMNELNGKPVIWHTINRLKSKFNSNKIIIAAPEFDAGGFDSLLEEQVSAYYGFKSVEVFPSARCKTDWFYKGKHRFAKCAYLPFLGTNKWAPSFLCGRATGIICLANKPMSIK